MISERPEGHMAQNGVFLQRRRRGQRIRRREKRRLKQAFLRELPAVEYYVSHACQALALSRNTFYHWLHRDHQFKEDYHALVDPPPYVPPTRPDFELPLAQMSDKELMKALNRLMRRRF